MKAGIYMDDWKKPIFERHLRLNGYAWTEGPGLDEGTVLLIVHTDNITALEVVVRAANKEAAQTGAPL